MQYLVFYPADDKDIRTHMSRWLSGAGGSLSLGDVERRLRERFGYVTKSIHDEATARRLGLFDKAYKLENGMVSC